LTRFAGACGATDLLAGLMAGLLADVLAGIFVAGRADDFADGLTGFADFPAPAFAGFRASGLGAVGLPTFSFMDL